MTTDLTVFTIPTGGELRSMLDEHGDPWFIAADVALPLGYRDTHNMVRRLDEDEKGTRSVSTPGGTQHMTVISEPGLYAAILGSKVEQAKTFKRWVTHEVLPSIRKTGRYEVATMSPRQLAELVIAESDRADRAQAALEAAKPMVDAWQTYLSTAGDMSVDETAKALARADIKIGRDKLFSTLHAWGWVYRSESKHTGKVGPWKAMQSQVDCGRLAMKPQPYEHPRTGEPRDGAPQVRVTPKGAEEIRRRLAPAP